MRRVFLGAARGYCVISALLFGAACKGGKTGDLRPTTDARSGLDAGSGGGGGRPASDGGGAGVGEGDSGTAGSAGTNGDSAVPDAPGGGGQDAGPGTRDAGGDVASSPDVAPGEDASTPRADAAPLVAGAATDYPYVSDLGDGTYRNPVVLADDSDPDPIRVGDDYYLVSSSFNCSPGLPIMHSRDLVNWTIVGHALEKVPGDRFSQPQHGQGVWAPSIRAHAATYYIVFPNYCKPADDGACAEEGIWVVTAPQPTGPWSQPYQLLAARGVIDPCPFWDDDGKAYLVHAYANSRAGISNRVDIRPMSPDATQMLGTGQQVFSDPTNQPTLEGPKMYKRNGWYYILAPAGGVPMGWELALRSKAIYGPYEAQIVLQQGSTSINGPHQGGIVDTPDGSEWWFLHFQDAGAYGRILHLNPVVWTNDWPLMGVAGAGGIRQPVTTHKKPTLPVQPIQIPQTSDEFADPQLGLQWQWSANYQTSWYSLAARPGYLRLLPQNVPAGDLTQAPNLLMQKVPARSFGVETTVELTGTGGASRAGLVVWGDPATALAVEESGTLIKVSLISNGSVIASDTVAKGPVVLRVALSTSTVASFSYGTGTGALRAFSQTVQMAARKGSWIGVKIGVFSIAAAAAPPGSADFDYFRLSPLAGP